MVDDLDSDFQAFSPVPKTSLLKKNKRVRICSMLLMPDKTASENEMPIEHKSVVTQTPKFHSYASPIVCGLFERFEDQKRT